MRYRCCWFACIARRDVFFFYLFAVGWPPVKPKIVSIEIDNNECLVDNAQCILIGRAVWWTDAMNACHLLDLSPRVSAAHQSLKHRCKELSRCHQFAVFLSLLEHVFHFKIEFRYFCSFHGNASIFECSFIRMTRRKMKIGKLMATSDVFCLA